MIRQLRSWMLLAAALAVAFAASSMAPPAASAATSAAIACPAIYPAPAWCSGQTEPKLAGTDYIGWAYLNLNYCPPNMACAAVSRESMPAWRWTASGWVRASLAQGRVYLYPYSGYWRWAWTSQTGWLAVYGGRFELSSPFREMLV